MKTSIILIIFLSLTIFACDQTPATNTETKPSDKPDVNSPVYLEVDSSDKNNLVYTPMTCDDNKFCRKLTKDEQYKKFGGEKK